MEQNHNAKAKTTDSVRDIHRSDAYMTKINAKIKISLIIMQYDSGNVIGFDPMKNRRGPDNAKNHL